MIIEYKPIGIIRSPFNELRAMPIQASRAVDVAGTVEIDPKFKDGLCDLMGFSHLILLYHFHKVSGYRLKVVPFLDKEPKGLFATRAPKRPNPIGMSVVRLCGIQENTLSVKDVDVLDGTPLLDIKPYVKDFDLRSKTKSGWLETAAARETVSDDRFL